MMDNYRSTPNILRVATQVIGKTKSAPNSQKKFCSPTKPKAKKSASRNWSRPKTKPPGLPTNSNACTMPGAAGKNLPFSTASMRIAISWWKNFRRRKIPFVISKLSILEHPLVRDVLAYLHLIALPFDDIACARVLSAPAWHMTSGRSGAPGGARGKETRHRALRCAPSAASENCLSIHRLPPAKELLEFLGAQRKTMRRRTAREILGDLIEWLEVPQRAAAQDRKYVNQLGQFIKDWEPKSETRGLPEFLEYLEYFPSRRHLSLEDDAPGDAVQLMTVHGAKGLEFPHVFVLRVNSGPFLRATARLFSNFPIA